MKSHLKLLRRCDALGAILAFQSLFTFEGEYVSDIDDTGIKTLALPDDETTRVLCVDSLDLPLLSAKEGGDGQTIEFKIVGPIQDYPQLTAFLAAMGGYVSPGSNAVNFHFREPLRANKEASNQIEELWSRWSTLDALWCANRQLSNHIADGPTVIEKLVTLYHRAKQWCTPRDLAFSGEDLTDRASDIRDAEMEKFRKEFAERPHDGLPNVSKCLLHEDPRAPAFTIEFSNNSRLNVSAEVVDWAVAPVIGAGPKLPKSVSEGKFAIKPTKVPSEVVAVLDSLLVSGKAVKIIEKLDAKLYKKVDETLRTIGGNWHSGSGAHIFEDDPSLLIDEITATGAIFTRRDFEFFETQEEQANRAVLLADLDKGQIVLEPSAGQGALALKAAAAVGTENVICYELMEMNVKHLQTLGFAVSDPVDFLAVEPSEIADRCIMNPPFSQGRDIAHIQHAYRFLKPGGKLVAIASTQWQTHDNARSKAFRKWLEILKANVEPIEAGAFKDVGTSVPTTLIYVAKPLAEQAEPQKTTPVKAVAPKPVKLREEMQVDLFAA